jgi:hypothetical protein
MQPGQADTLNRAAFSVALSVLARLRKGRLEDMNPPRARASCHTLLGHVPRAVLAMYCALAAIPLVAGCARHTAPTTDLDCTAASLTGSLDMWPAWGPSYQSFTYLHNSRGATDSTYICVATIDSLRILRRARVANCSEISSCDDCGLIAFNSGLQISILGADDGPVQLTYGDHGCHWPEVSPNGRLISYSRIFRYPSDPDSASGLRVLDAMFGQDRAVMRNATRPWYADGPATWSADGNMLAFFDADSVMDGKRRLVVVPMGGGEGRTIAWVEGIPGRASWMPGNDDFLFDTTPARCPTTGQRRSYRVASGSAQPRFTSYELGDASVQFGFPFVVSRDGLTALHVGRGENGLGLVIATDVATGIHRELTKP